MSTWNATRFLAVFLVVLFAGDRLLALGLDKAIRFSSLPYAKFYSGRGKADVLVLGNSRAFRHFDEKQLSRALGLKVSNLAVLGGSMETMNVVLNDYIARYGPPRAVIIEPSCMSGDNAQIRNMRLFTRHSPALQTILQDVSPNLATAGKISHLFTLNGTAYLNALHKIISPYRQVLFEGSVSLDDVQPPERPYFFNRQNNLIALRKTLKVLKQHQIRFEVVVSPVFSGFQATRAGYQDWIKSLSRVAGGEERISDYAELSLPAAAFYDPVHLNRKGVALFFDRLVSGGVIARLRGSLESAVTPITVNLAI